LIAAWPRALYEIPLLLKPPSSVSLTTTAGLTGTSATPEPPKIEYSSVPVMPLKL
jgi:hypothetical protein